MARKKLSRDQKRKQKLAERKKKTGGAVTPYEGNKYRDEKFLPFLFEAECGILEADALTEETLTDRDVKHVLEELVLELRGEKPAAEVGKNEDLTASRIRVHWAEVQSRVDFLPSNADLAGVLRTIIDSLNTRTHMTPGGRGYLSYLGPFLARAGFQVRRAGPDVEILGPPEPWEDDLWEAGRDWVVEGVAEAREAFLDLAAEQVRAGNAERVQELFERLAQESGDPFHAERVRQEGRRICGSSWRDAGPPTE